MAISHSRAVLTVLALLASSGCGGDSSSPDAAVSIGPCVSEACDGAICFRCPPLPAGNVPDGSAVNPSWLDPKTTVHFRFDPQRPPAALPIRGDSRHGVWNEIVSGSVRLTFRDMTTGVDVSTIAGPAFNFPPMAAASPDGHYLVCWTVLTGAESAATTGGTPDPRNGTTTVCRASEDSGSTWSTRIVLPQGMRTTGTTGVQWVGEGAAFDVSTYEDAEGTLFNDWDPRACFVRRLDGNSVRDPRPDPSCGR